MTLWPSALAELPGLGLRVISGRDGLDQRGPITSVHQVDTPDLAPWINGGEVVLAAAEILGGEDQVRDFVHTLAARGGAAICVHGRNAGDTEVPEALVQACNEQMLPLLIVPPDLPLFAVSRTIASAIQQDHQRQLSNTVGLHRKVIEAVVRGGGGAEVLRTVGQAMDRPTLVAHDYTGAEIARYDPAERLGGVSSTDLAEVVNAGGGDLLGFEVVTERVTQRHALEAVVALILDRRLEMYDRLMLQQAAAGMSLEIARDHSGRMANREKVTTLLEGATTRSASVMRLRAGLERLGFASGEPWRLVVFTGVDDEVKQNELASAVEDLYGSGRRPAVGILDNWIVALIPAQSDMTDGIQKLVETLRWADIQVGLSRAKSDGLRLAAAFREASVAVSLSESRVTFIDGLGVKGLVAGLREELGAPELIRAVLGPLTDPNQNIDLLETVRAYFANACRAGPTAAELGIHRHTLTYRLERIVLLTGLDPRDGENILAFALAIELMASQDTMQRAGVTDGSPRRKKSHE